MIGAKSSASAACASAIVCAVHGCPTSAASAFAARFGVAAMPPKAIRAERTTPPSTATCKPTATAEMSSSRRLVIL